MLPLSIAVVLFSTVLIVPTASQSAPPDEPAVFRFHMASEPSSFNPAQFGTTEASYFFNAVYEGLFRYQTGRGLISAGATKCVFKNPLLLICDLNPNARWSDGSKIVAADYVRAFHNLLGPGAKAPGAEALRNIKGAQASFAGHRAVTEIGVRAPDPLRLEFTFATPDPDFLFKTTSPLLAPIKSTSFPDRAQAPSLVVNGPYMIERWEIGKKIRLKPNPYYATSTRAKNKKQGTGFNPPFNLLSNPPSSVAKPPVEILFVDEDETALSLYDQGILTFLRRLPTSLIEKYQTRPDFLQVQIARFDYIGFGSALKDQPQLRRALSHALDFKELQRVLRSQGLPGCPALPDTYFKEVPCLSFDLQVARVALSKVPTEVQKRRWTLEFSKLGGDDNKKTAEWMQAQWKKNLDITIDLQQVEQSGFLHHLRENPPPLFRKGVGLERPTCLAALETFAPDGTENFLRISSPQFSKILQQLGHAESEAEKKRLCTKGTRFLIDENYLIPLGQIRFSFLVQTRFKGWHLNELNQLDLTDLRN